MENRDVYRSITTSYLKNLVLNSTVICQNAKRNFSS